MNSPEDGPVGPKHVEIRQYINKIEIVTSVGFYSIYSETYLFLMLRVVTWRCFWCVQSGGDNAVLMSFCQTITVWHVHLLAPPSFQAKVTFITLKPTDCADVTQDIFRGVGVTVSGYRTLWFNDVT